jgi:hypothetical protein
MAAMKTRHFAHGKAGRYLRPAAVLVLVILAFPACFSFRVTVPAEPECVLGVVAVVRSEPQGRNFEEPLLDEPVVATDAAIYSLVKVLQVSKPLTLQWLWYSPDNQLARRSKTVEINAKSRYLAYFAAWDKLDSPYFAEKKGKWIVMITADGSFLARKEFTIN